MERKKNSKIVARLVSSLLCLAMIASGVKVTVSGDMTYKNYWGGVVFGPLAILIGILFLYIVIFRWKALEKQMVDKKGQPIRFPQDDIEKW